MIIFARLKPKKIKITRTEPIIIHTTDIPRDLIITCGIVLILVIIGWFVFRSHTHRRPSISSTYTIHYERWDTKYYSRELDKVLIRPWYKYDEIYPMQGTGKLEGSCVDSWCNFSSTPEQLYSEFEKDIWKKYFIR